MLARKPRSTDTLVGARCVDTCAVILAKRGCVFTFIRVIKAARAFVARRTGTCVATTGQRAAPSTVGTGTRETAVLMLTAQSCPSSGALTLVVVKGQEGADTLVGTGVVWVTCGVLGSLAVLSGVAKRAGAGGTARYRHTG